MDDSKLQRVRDAVFWFYVPSVACVFLEPLEDAKREPSGQSAYARVSHGPLRVDLELTSDLLKL